MDECLSEKHISFLAATDCTSLNEKERNIKETLDTLGTSPIHLFRRKILEIDLKDVDRERKRYQRKRALFHELTADAEDAEIQRQAVEQRSIKRAKTTSEVVISEEDLTIRDIVMFDSAQTSSTPINDKCVNCETAMRRDTISQLVCPKCGFIKCNIDASNPSSASAGSYARKEGASGENLSVPKQLLHFLTFLAACQGKTTREFDTSLIDRLCKYAYVQGCRKPEDITKDIINRAQRYEGGSTEHTRSILYRVILRGHSIRYPADILHKMQLMFRKLWPAYFVNKELLYKDRSNTQAYKFIARMNFRMLGVPFLLDTVEPFKMSDTKLMHSAFTRTIFKKDLLWKWEDGRITEEGITDTMIDRYETTRNEKGRTKSHNLKK
jgi:hypothetical protein